MEINSTYIFYDYFGYQLLYILYGWSHEDILFSMLIRNEEFTEWYFTKQIENIIYPRAKNTTFIITLHPKSKYKNEK